MTQQAIGGERVFLRTASGLIKTASTLDVFIFNTGLISVGIGASALLLYGPSIYPGGDLSIAVLIALVGMSFIASGMLCWTVTLPRSGGVYVFGTRSLFPPLAFTMSFVECSAWLFYSATAAGWITTVGIVPAIYTLALVSGNQGITNVSTAVSTPAGIFLIGSTILILSGVLLASGMRRFFLVQRVTIAVALLGTVLAVVVLATSSHEGFVAQVNHYLAGVIKGPGQPYDQVIAIAKQHGWGNPGFSLGATFAMSVWTFLPFIGAAFSISIGGEIKQVVRGQLIGMYGALIVNAAGFLLLAILAVRVIGYDFMGAIAYNFLNSATIPATAGGTTPVTPWITLLVGILTGNPLVTALICLGFIAWIYLWVPSQQAYGERGMIAWAFDRLAPARVGYVSNRFHTPVVAIVIATTVTVIFLGLINFTSWFATVIFIEAGVAAWGVVLFAGIFFPYRRRSLYEKSPISSYRVAGVPIMSVSCFFATLACAWFFWLLFSDPFAAGHTGTAALVVVGWFVAGLVLYFVMYFARRSQGVDVNRAFREIPIE